MNSTQNYANIFRKNTFYYRWHHRNEVNPSKVLIFHAKDDPQMPCERSREFAEMTGVALKSLKRGGHISTDYVIRKCWPQIKNVLIPVATEKGPRAKTECKWL